MSINFKYYRFLFLMLTISFSSVFAAAPVFTYRGIVLGDTLDAVKVKIASEFSRFEVIHPVYKYDTYSIKAGDDNSILEGFCPYAATSNRQKNCVFALLQFSREMKLHGVYFKQGITPPVSLNFLLDKLVKSYGKPRLTFRKKLPASHPSNTAFIEPPSEITSLVWGGEKTPTDFYENSSFPGDAITRIGGKFLSITIHHEGNLVNGYSLRITDSDSIIKTSSEIDAEINNQRIMRKKMNEESLKF